MPTKRTRRPRGPVQRVTPAAARAWAEGNRLELHRHLGLKPWEPSPFDVVEPRPPAWAEGSPWGAAWPRVVELRAALLEHGKPGRAY